MAAPCCCRYSLRRYALMQTLATYCDRTADYHTCSRRIFSMTRTWKVRDRPVIRTFMTAPMVRSSAAIVPRNSAATLYRIRVWAYSPGYCILSRYEQRAFLHSVIKTGDITVEYQKGIPVITAPLPSRQERCQFRLRPIGNTLHDFIQALQREDKGIDFVAAYTPDGVRIAASASIESLLMNNFHLIINNATYLVQPPDVGRTDPNDPFSGPISSESSRTLADIQQLVARLYEDLSVGEHQLTQERKILDEIHQIEMQLQPLDEIKEQMMVKARRRTTLIGWLGLCLMGVQFGILARLTWWEYSWDIMEPVTYFVTYGTTMLAYAYFIVTKQDYYLPDVRDREFLKSFHHQAKGIQWDTEQYNWLREKLDKCNEDLMRLRDPLQRRLPMKEICPECGEEEDKRRKD